MSPPTLPNIQYLHKPVQLFVFVSFFCWYGVKISLGIISKKWATKREKNGQE